MTTVFWVQTWYWICTPYHVSMTSSLTVQKVTFGAALIWQTHFSKPGCILMMPISLQSPPPLDFTNGQQCLRALKMCLLSTNAGWMLPSVLSLERFAMKALIAAWLFCNPKKCAFFLMEMDFLSHHISTCGIKLNMSKIQKILDWPVLTSSTEVQAFLGLVWW